MNIDLVEGKPIPEVDALNTLILEIDSKINEGVQASVVEEGSDQQIDRATLKQLRSERGVVIKARNIVELKEQYDISLGAAKYINQVLSSESQVKWYGELHVEVIDRDTIAFTLDKTNDFSHHQGGLQKTSELHVFHKDAFTSTSFKYRDGFHESADNYNLKIDGIVSASSIPHEDGSIEFQVELDRMNANKNVSLVLSPKADTVEKLSLAEQGAFEASVSTLMDEKMDELENSWEMIEQSGRRMMRDTPLPLGRTGIQNNKISEI